MGEIFLSYAREDRALATIVAKALTANGWSVWWDREILAGSPFDEVISGALDGANCVVVLWTRASIQSDWVREEALEGARRRILVPVLLEDVEIPLGLRRIQAAHLQGWKGAKNAPEMVAFISAVAKILGSPRSLPEPHPPPAGTPEEVATQPLANTRSFDDSLWNSKILNSYPFLILLVLAVGVGMGYFLFSSLVRDISPFWAGAISLAPGCICLYGLWRVRQNEK
jgi:hypothetical protein